MTAHAPKPVFISPAYARAVAEVRARKATALFLEYIAYKAALHNSPHPLALAPYAHYLEMLDYYPDPEVQKCLRLNARS
jgi:hypothetical protein